MNIQLTAYGQKAAIPRHKKPRRSGVTEDIVRRGTMHEKSKRIKSMPIETSNCVQENNHGETDCLQGPRTGHVRSTQE